MAYTNVAGKKLQSKLGGVLNESVSCHTPALLSSDKSFAKRQLEKMGWQEGTGLGKRRDGITDHIKIKQREDEMGLGREKETAKEIGNQWWKDSVGGTLAKLQARKSKDSKKDTKKSKKKTKRSKTKERGSVAAKIYTDEELYQATGGARFGTKGGRRVEGKVKRTESGNESVEQAARSQMEWNGRGDAHVILKDSKVKKRKATSDACEVKAVSPSESASEEDDEDRRERKRRRKAEKKASKGKTAEDDADGDKSSKRKKKKKKEDR